MLYDSRRFVIECRRSQNESAAPETGEILRLMHFPAHG
jgi:hypothetical protein